jgi:hypothetical protein
MTQSWISFTYDHRTLRTELPVRSAELKQCTGGLVVRWVTTGEYPLLYVFLLLGDLVRVDVSGGERESLFLWVVGKGEEGVDFVVDVQKT